MHVGERIAAVNETEGRKYLCEIRKLEEECILCGILSEEEADTELSSKIYLFQGLPKGDKMELILQKAVELGCFEVVPVACRRCVVKLEEKKQKSRVQRWQSIRKPRQNRAGAGSFPVCMR